MTRSSVLPGRPLEHISPFEEIKKLGSKFEIEFKSSKKAKIILHIYDKKVIPKQSKSLLKSGKISIKDMPIGKYNELYQDYVCSATLRVGREVFAILPVEEIIITAKGDILNNSTGRIEKQPLLSILLIKETMNKINFDLVDPSDCMSNFKHNMVLKKTQGMFPVEEIE